MVRDKNTFTVRGLDDIYSTEKGWYRGQVPIGLEEVTKQSVINFFTTHVGNTGRTHITYNYVVLEHIPNEEIITSTAQEWMDKNDN